MSKGLLRVFYICLGSLSLSLGILGFSYRFLPTTPLLLLTAFVTRSSQNSIIGYQPTLHRPIIKTIMRKKGFHGRRRSSCYDIVVDNFTKCLRFIEQYDADVTIIATGVTIFILKQKTK